jgi:hypothetical protein
MTYKEHLENTLADIETYVGKARAAFIARDMMELGMNLGKIEVTIARVPNTTPEMLDEEMPVSAPQEAFESHPSTIARGGVR